ncbi:uncharacterized protein EI97DRAFT_465586 [Westerdykella ornata]|uniref:Zn(2)-C6 fungal-type domain-containing protein n=1 Tax=Westerdykella ornata TaxID=318751 RepID=A0A6A6JNZ2_WESOR|nr:uncharacterized protein EI97DRAFT_465586 [Westerdykella ornata]KAF2278242.1 hypothetical protein EI97DRAFT_465586 [Westerdykella ornata]
MSAVKRAACDRCHGLKMRCIREENRAKCNRCLGAGSVCVFSVCKKAGRPARKNHYGHQHQHRHQPTPIQQSSPPYIQSNPSIDISLFSTSQDNFSMAIADEYLSASALSGALSDPIPDLPMFGLEMDEAVPTGRNPRETHHQWLEDFFSVSDFDKQRDPVIVEPTSHRFPSSTTQNPSSVGGNAMQQLSELSGKLFAHINAGTKESTTESATTRLEELSARVIENTVDFYNILSNNSEPAFEASLDHGEVTATATTLQILTAYIRLTQLHQALYNHIHSLLSPRSPPLFAALPESRDSNSSGSSPSSSDRGVPVLFPSLSIGGISLAPYPRFQLKMIVQICVHHLGEVESLLRLPAGFSVSDEGANGGDNREGGILYPDSDRMALLVRTIMLEAGDSVKGIRRVLAELAEEFRGSIQV